MDDRIEFHPISDIFPMLPDRDLQELADDIRKNGLITPILLFEGKILDGRNRARACEMAEIDTKFEVFQGSTVEQALDYVLSANLHRRHLTTMQKYEALEKASDIREKAKERQREHGGTAPGVGKKSLPAVTAGSDLDEENQKFIDDKKNKDRREKEAAHGFARMLDVSPRTVYKMVQIEREAPAKLLEAVRQGDVSINRASIALSTLEKKDLDEILEETESGSLDHRLGEEIKSVEGDTIKGKQKRKKRQPVRLEYRPFQDVERVEMHLGRLQQFWIQSTPEVRAEFVMWINDHKEEYPIREGMDDEE